MRDATGPTYDFWARCWFCNEQKVHAVNEYERNYGDEGTTTVTGGLYCPLCDLALCHECIERNASRIACRA